MAKSKTSKRYTREFRQELSRCIAPAEASRSCRASLVPHPGQLRCG